MEVSYLTTEKDGKGRKMAKEKESITIDGVKIYDSRLKKFVVSSNPALILGDIAQNVKFLPNWDTAIYDGNLFWNYIAKMADVCDGNDFSIETEGKDIEND